jgi:AcrR family transcriptional regulator
MAEVVRRSDRTRSAILAAARERFAADGFERATIRAIAADADIDPSMVMRYYGNKERLFAAAAEFDLRLPDLAAVPRRGIGGALVTHFLDRWEEDETLQLLLRTAGTHQAAVERMQTVFTGQLLPAVAALYPPSEAPGEVARRAGLAAAQILGLALCRYVLRLPPVVTMDRDALLDWVGPTVQRSLTGAPTAPR